MMVADTCVDVQRVPNTAAAHSPRLDMMPPELLLTPNALLPEMISGSATNSRQHRMNRRGCLQLKNAQIVISVDVTRIRTVKITFKRKNRVELRPPGPRRQQLAV